MSAPRGDVCSRGVSAPGGGVWGVCSQGGVCSWGWGVSAPGGLLPACTEADPPVDRMTHMCKNITFLQTLFAGGN